jgi:S1-C subfamily serine protease
MDHDTFLTDEQRSTIENEERRRIAEEQYRAEIRAKLTGSVQAAPSRGNRKILAMAALGMIASGAFTAAILRKGTPSPPQIVQASANVSAEKDVSKPSPLPPPLPAKLTTAEIADRAAPFVVVVESFGEDGEKPGQGSGYIHGQGGPVITNYHVIRGASRLVVRTHTGTEISTEALLGYDAKADLAALVLLR